MGTNYYLKFKDEELHIGKSSNGWKFLWRAYPELEIYTIRDWIHFILVNELESNLYDEYKDSIDMIEFFEKIANNKRREKDFGKEIKEHSKEFIYQDAENNDFTMEEFC